jgi:hypothetical protein
MRTTGTGVEAYLQLQPGESIFVRTWNAKAAPGPAWTYWQPPQSKAEISGDWRVEFVSGGPSLPATFTTSNTGSWARQGGAAEHFAGTARYSVTFAAPAAIHAPVWLDLGNVSQSARVKLNGQDYGRLITPPFRVLVDDLQPTNNKLEVEVTSTSANAIRYYDQEKFPWKNFRDINFVNQDYKPFNAATWPVAEAGLLGPVTLMVATSQNPAGGVK